METIALSLCSACLNPPFSLVDIRWGRSLEFLSFAQYYHSILILQKSMGDYNKSGCLLGCRYMGADMIVMFMVKRGAYMQAKRENVQWVMKRVSRRQYGL